MKKLENFILLIVGLFIISSCNVYRLVVNSDNDYTFHIILLVLVVLALFVLFRTYCWRKKKEEVTEQLLNRRGLSLKDFFDSGSYVGGYPSIDEMIPSLFFKKDADDIVFYYRHNTFSMPEEKFRIPTASIIDVELEDSPNVANMVEEHKIVLARPFTFDWRRMRKFKSYYVAVEWSDQNVVYTTLFYFDGYNSMFRANEFRYKLIHGIKTVSPGM